MEEKWLFFKNFIKNPLQNASVIPSSKKASISILQNIDFEEVNTIVELGAGNGNFTQFIIDKARKGTKIILVEIESSYIEILEEKFGDRAIIEHKGAHQLSEILQKHGVEHVDLLVSGLPFLPTGMKDQTFETIDRLTQHGTIFRFFTYMPPIMKVVYKDLPIEKKQFVFQNIPPMWIYGIN